MVCAPCIGLGNFTGVETPLQKAPHPRGIKTADSTCALVIASDPISDTFTQVVASVASPPREKKRSFAQAELEEMSPGQGTTEDDLRRKQGPPKVSPGAEPGETAVVELQSTDKCYQPHVGGYELGGEAPTSLCFLLKSLLVDYKKLQKRVTKVHPGLPDVGHCLVPLLVKVIKVHHATLRRLMPLLQVGMESSLFLMESPRSCPFSRKSLVTLLSLLSLRNVTYPSENLSALSLGIVLMKNGAIHTMDLPCSI